MSLWFWSAHFDFSKPRQDVLTEYSRKVNFLKGLIETEKMASSHLKFPDYNLFNGIALSSRKGATSERFIFVHWIQESASKKAMAAELLTPAPLSSESSAPSRELHIQTKARYQKEVRDELLGNSDDTSRSHTFSPVSFLLFFPLTVEGLSVFEPTFVFCEVFVCRCIFQLSGFYSSVQLSCCLSG